MPDGFYIEINVATQQLHLWADGILQQSYPVSTAARGTGQQQGSECTPLGKHGIRIKIGKSCPINTVFTGRRPTGETYHAGLAHAKPGRDWILTRILWLTGKEPGYNRGGACDTLRRYIYIHGTPDTSQLGKPVSHGCIRMRNQDLIELFDRVSVGTPVTITAAEEPLP